MIRETKLYCVLCDGCGREALEDEDIAPDSERSAAWLAEKQGWNTTLVHGGDDLCPECMIERYRQHQSNERERRAARQEG